jgi:hypothetical protein
MIVLGSVFAIAAVLTATVIGARMRRRVDASAPAGAVVAALDAGGLDALGAMVAPTVPPAPAVAAPPRDVDPPRPPLARPDSSRRAVEKPVAAGVDGPAVPERPATAAELASLYVAVGRQLKALGDERGPDAATDLWTLYTRIRIDDAFTDPVKRAEVDALLRQLHDQIVERSR